MSFGSDIRAYAELQKRNIREVFTESLIDLSAAVIIKTPVDTGILANSWRPTTAAPSRSDKSFAGAEAQAAAISEKVELALDRAGIYYLVNNQVYARVIEYEGHSDKAPRGMLRISIENYQNFIDNAISKL